MRYINSDVAKTFIRSHMTYLSEHIERKTKLDEAFYSGYETAHKHITELLDVIPGENVMPRTVEAAVAYLNDCGWLADHDKEIAEGNNE